MAAAVASAQRTPADPPRIVAIGDIHGAAGEFVAILQRAGLIDARRRWNGGRDVLVQTGDFTDRGEKVREVMDLLMALEGQASSAGGRVHILLGNHETMNLTGDVRDVTPEIYATFADGRSSSRLERAYREYVTLCNARAAALGRSPPVYTVVPREEWLAARPPGFLEYRQAFGPRGRYGRWLRSRPAILQIDDTIFLHGGITPELALTIEQMNKGVRAELQRFDQLHQYMVERKLILPFFTFQEMFEAAQIEMEEIQADPTGAGTRPTSVLDRERPDAEAIHRVVIEEVLAMGTWLSVHPDGPLWFRGYARWSDAEGAQHVETLADRHQARRFIVGHTIPPTFRITPRFDQRVFLIDTGMLTSVYKGRPSALELLDGRATAIYLDERISLTPTSPDE
jgi:hypothetical protein